MKNQFEKSKPTFSNISSNGYNDAKKTSNKTQEGGGEKSGRGNPRKQTDV